MNGIGSCLLSLAALGLLAPMSADGVRTRENKPKLTVHNVQRIYHPSTFSERRTYAKVASVTSRTFFDATPEYQQITKRKLSPTSAEWALLVKSASDKFKSAVAKSASNAGYDLIAEAGAVSLDEGTIADATSDVVSRMPAAGR
jgi:hypothetical protein